MRPCGVGFGESVLLTAEGIFVAGAWTMVGGAEGAVAHAELVIDVVPSRACGGCKIDLVPGPLNVVDYGCECTVETGACVKRADLPGFHNEAGAGVAGCACGELPASEFDFVADV